jgi:HlyD family secretion protein
LTREVRGLGELTPEEVFHIPAPYAGRVDTLKIVIGAPVSPETVIAELKSTEIEQLVKDAKLGVQTAESDLANLKAQSQSQLLAQDSEVGTLQNQYRDAKLKNDRDQVLYKEGLELELDFRLSTNLVQDLSARLDIERRKGGALRDSLEAQIAGKQTALNQLRETLRSRSEQLQSLEVRAGSAGVVEQMLVQVGQQLAAGADIAVVMDPRRLKAVLAVPEAQARSILVGQKAEIQTPEGNASGWVSRIDPSVINGTRSVDVRLDGMLPPGAVPDKTVDGLIEIERLSHVLKMKRPVGTQEGSEVSLFKVSADGKTARRVPVRLGRSSLREIEILEGLNAGDRIILSDMSAFEGYDLIRLR